MRYSWIRCPAVIVFLIAGAAAGRAAVIAADMMPSDAALAAMSEPELIQGFRDAHSLHAYFKSFAASEAYAWALRLRFPDSAEAPAIESRLAVDLLLRDYGDRDAALAGMKRFLPGGPYAAHAPEAYWMRYVYASDLFAQGQIDEAADVCREAISQTSGTLVAPHWFLDLQRLLYDLRLLRDESARVADLVFCQQELQRMADAAGAELNRWPPPDPSQPETPALHNARRMSVVAPRRMQECLDAAAPDGSAERLRADAASYARLGDICAKHRRPYDAYRQYFIDAAAVGRRWLALPQDAALARNLDAMRHVAIAIGRTEPAKESQATAHSLFNTVWSSRYDPAAVDGDPWCCIVWLYACGANIGMDQDEAKRMFWDALLRSERLMPENYRYIFDRFAEWARLAGDEDAAALYILDFADIVGPYEEFYRVYPDALAASLRLQDADPARVDRLANRRSDAFEAMLDSGALEQVDGHWRIKPRRLWADGHEG